MGIHRRWIIGIALLLGVMAAGPAQGQQAGPPQVLRVGLNAEPDNIDPHLLLQTESMRVMEQMYSSLLRLSPTLQIQPDLATKWQVSEDGKTYTFTLRQGVKFHNGRPLTAKDVQYSLGRMADPKVKSPWAYLFADLSEIRVVDDHTVQIVMKAPAAHILAALATPFAGIVPREAVDQYGNLKTKAVGTGPFRLVEWVPGQRIVQERYKEYHVPGLPKLDRVEWLFIEDPSTRVQQLLSKTIDLDIDVPLGTMPDYQRAAGVKVVGGEVVSYYYLAFNVKRKPFGDPRVRQAIAWQVNREEIVTLAADGQGTPILGGPIPSSHWAFAKLVVYPRVDAEKARRLLAEAGYPAGFSYEMMTRKGEAPIAQAVQQQLRKIGIDARIVVAESGAYNNRLYKEHDFDGVASRWGTLIDPDDFLYGQFVTGGGWNPYGFGNSDVDQLLKQGREFLNPDKRREIYRQAEQRIAELAPYVFLYRPKRFAAFQAYVDGLQHEVANTRLSLRETRVTRGN